MSQDLKSVVTARLKELGRNPFEAARIGELERSYINDILIERKRSIRDASFTRVAAALDWSAAELMEALGRAPSTISIVDGASITVTKSDLREVVALLLRANKAEPELADALAEAAVECLSAPPLDALDGDVVRSFEVRFELRAQQTDFPRSQ